MVKLNLGVLLAVVVMLGILGLSFVDAEMPVIRIGVNNNSQLINDSGWITKTVSDLVSYYTITQINAFGFITNTVSDLVNYYNKIEVYNKTESDGRYIQDGDDPNLWTVSFNSTGDDRWLDDTDTNETIRVDALYDNVTGFLNNTQLSEADVDSYADNNGYYQNGDSANFTNITIGTFTFTTEGDYLVIQ